MHIWLIQNLFKSDKPKDLTMNELILEFEHLCNKMKENYMVLPKNVLTFKLLDSANLISEDDRKLALTL